VESQFKVYYTVNVVTCFFQRKLVTMIPGDGIGPEISASVQQIFGAAGVCILPASISKCSDIYIVV